MKLGIDIGGTNITLGLVKDGKLKSSIHVPSFDREWNQEQTIDYLSENIEKIITGEVTGIGIGVPSVVDVEKGIVYDTANIPSWQNIPLKQLIQKRFDIQTMVNNDANCYALGTYTLYPADDRPDSMVTVTLGTGLGTGIILNGKIYSGANCGAGEIGCLPYKDSILEDYCSKGFFIAKGNTPKDFYTAAKNGDATALEVFREFGRNLGYAVCIILYMYDPRRIVFGGGVANSSDLFIPEMLAYVKEHFAYHKTVERIRFDTMTDDDIPVIGAASLV